MNLVEFALHAPTVRDGNNDRYPDLTTKAAVLCARLARIPGLPDGNKRVALSCLRTFLSQNGIETTFGDDEESTSEVADAVRDLASKRLTEESFTEWLNDRVRSGRPTPCRVTIRAISTRRAHSRRRERRRSPKHVHVETEASPSTAIGAGRAVGRTVMSRRRRAWPCRARGGSCCGSGPSTGRGCRRRTR